MAWTKEAASGQTLHEMGGQIPSANKDIPDGLEVAPQNEGDKEVVQPEKELAHHNEEFPIPVGKAQPDEDRKMYEENVKPSHGPKRVCSMRVKSFFILLAVVTVFALGLAIGLGVGLSSKDSGEPSSEPSDIAPSPSTPPPAQEAFSIGGGLNDSYYSTKGAWNGSGLGWTWQTFSSDLVGQPQGQPGLVIYYQHYTGAIQWMRRSNDSSWLRGSEGSEDVAVDARNATPINIDQDHQVRQRSGNNLSMGWIDGPINNANLTAHDGDMAGLQACWSGIGWSVPMRLWYASDNTTFEEYLYHAKEDEWKWQKSWKNLSGAAGVGCYSWTGPHSYIYAAFVNLQGQVEIYYRDKRDKSLSLDDGWEKSEAIIPDVHLASSISLDGYSSVVQKPGDDKRVWASKMNWNGRDTQVVDSQAFSLDDRILGTRVVALPFSNEEVALTPSNGADAELVIFSQGDGDDIIPSSRGLEENWDDLESGTETNILPS